MNLLFCSNLNNKIDHEFINLFNKPIRIGYIPSKHVDGNLYFEEIKKYYADTYNISDVICLDIDKSFSNKFTDLLNSCDILILSGGNTQYFFNKLKKRDILDSIKEFASDNDKGIIGISAGGIIMTPNINIGDLFEKQKIRNEKSLGLVDFEFCPHYGIDDIPDNFKEYIKNKNIRFCKENDFILINNN